MGDLVQESIVSHRPIVNLGYYSRQELVPTAREGTVVPEKGQFSAVDVD